MTDLIELFLGLEDNDDLHESRLLVLMAVFAGKDGLGTIEGLTKLAKLDFLLRYPLFLERALRARDVGGVDLKIEEYERHSVESRMVRFRYGPWDFRYRRLINLLAGKGLVHVTVEGRTVHLGLTKMGLQVAGRLTDANRDLCFRAGLLKKYFEWKGTRLMRFIYATFPEIVNLRFGEEII